MPISKIEVRRSRLEHFSVPAGQSGNDTFVNILIFLQELPLTNRGVRGGLPASEVDLDFRLDV
jgi:hypothetical protein